MHSQAPVQNQREQNTQPEQPSDTYVPQTLVFGAFLAIFFAQVGINFLQVVRTRRRGRRALELQFPQPLPQQVRVRNWEPGMND